MPDWTVLVPLKRLSAAKSRLHPPTMTVPRESLALAFALDTLHAAANCPAVGRVVAVTADPAVREAVAGAGLDAVDEGPRPGLNEAIRHAAARLRAADPAAPLAAMTGDLPALKPGELAEALARAARLPRSFVPDAAGTGTVLLAANTGSELDPSFGPGSARAHRASGATPLDGLWPSLRRDVDTRADLAAAGSLGVGRHTLVLLLRARRCNVGHHAGHRGHVRPPNPYRDRLPR
ncbi:2-phospho-L-lactate guanylyltransferase [Phytomonospora sp. NPDC050363]|uniref:2-phospho-L-lactate guanylyltransferase n=1 Tax=Phytomonospora sp. NPDC050363 TaxID=3155642 RepID=UPI0033C248CB